MEDRAPQSMRLNRAWLQASTPRQSVDGSPAKNRWNLDLHNSSFDRPDLVSHPEKRSDTLTPSRLGASSQRQNQTQQCYHPPVGSGLGGAFPPPTFGLSTQAAEKGDMHYSMYAAEGAAMDSTYTVDTSNQDEDAQATVASLKEQVDVLIAAMMMHDTPSSGIHKGVDAVEVSHRVMTRLNMLREENTRLAQLVNGKATASLEAQNARLMRENEDLRAELAHLTQKQAIGFGVHQQM